MWKYVFNSSCGDRINQLIIELNEVGFKAERPVLSYRGDFTPATYIHKVPWCKIPSFLDLFQLVRAESQMFDLHTGIDYSMLKDQTKIIEYVNSLEIPYSSINYMKLKGGNARDSRQHFDSHVTISPSGMWVEYPIFTKDWTIDEMVYDGMKSYFIRFADFSRSRAYPSVPNPEVESLNEIIRKYLPTGEYISQTGERYTLSSLISRVELSLGLFKIS